MSIEACQTDIRWDWLSRPLTRNPQVRHIWEEKLTSADFAFCQKNDSYDYDTQLFIFDGERTKNIKRNAGVCAEQNYSKNHFRGFLNNSYFFSLAGYGGLLCVTNFILSSEKIHLPSCADILQKPHLPIEDSTSKSAPEQKAKSSGNTDSLADADDPDPCHSTYAFSLAEASFYYEKGVYDLAIKEFRRLAKFGCIYAQLMAGYMYAEGEGVPTNDVRAYMWWSLAKAHGVEEAAEGLDILKKQMTPAQIAKAQKLAAEWWEEHND